MAIIIIKKNRVSAPAPAPVVPPPAAVPAAPRPGSGCIRIPIKKPPVKPTSPIHEPLTPEEILAKWKRVPPPGAKAKECPFCHQWYIMPCNQNEAGGCQNYAWYQQHGVKK